MPRPRVTGSVSLFGSRSLGWASFARGNSMTGTLDGAVGTNMPFPESGITPASFLYTLLGIEAHTTGLAITPNLPSDLAWAGAQNLHWRSRRLDVSITQSAVTVAGPGVSLHKRYRPGDTIWVPTP